MESNYWLRFGTIIMMLLGCFYVLSPNVLLEKKVDTDIASTGEVGEPSLEAWFNLPADANAVEVADAFQTRLKAGGLDFERVEFVDDDDRITVHLRVGGASKAAIEALARPVGQLSLYAADATTLDAEALAAADDPAAVLAAARPAGTALVVPDLSVSLASGIPTVLGTVPAGADTPWLLTLDGATLAAVQDATPGVDGGRGALWLLGSAPNAAQTALLASGPLGATLTRHVAKVKEEIETIEEVAEVKWYEPFLPNTKLALGLDLQGGIDLTLQVDLDAAVFSQVQRDRVQLREQVLRDGKDIVADRDRTRPAMKLHSNTMSAAELRTYIGKWLSRYRYMENVTEEDGTSVEVWRIDEAREDEIKKQAVEQVLETLRKRVDSTGVKEPSIVKMGGGRINIQLPGIEDAEQATDAIGTQAVLQFRLVDPKSSDAEVNRLIREAEKVLPPDQFASDELINEWLWRTDRLADDRLIMFNYDEAEPGVTVRTEPIQLIHEIILTGSDLNNAGVVPDPVNPRVQLDFKPRGGKIFCDVTTANVGRRFAIILDNEVRSAPVIREKICGGSASIDMGQSVDAMKDANTLALVLRTGSLTAPVDIGEVRKIGSTLGADAIAAGTRATMIGGFLTLFFMALWYGKPGMIADVALVLNVLLVFSLLAMFGATLTLPGMAGIALTIGMAVDANIIIYERIREELALGVNPRKAVDVGYEKGVVAVLDANITTAIAGVVLYSYGTGPIKGFAVTLLIGIFTTLVTALFVTRTFMEMLTRNSNARLRI